VLLLMLLAPAAGELRQGDRYEFQPPQKGPHLISPGSSSETSGQSYPMRVGWVSIRSRSRWTGPAQPIWVSVLTPQRPCLT